MHIGVVIVLPKLQVDYEKALSAHSVVRFIVGCHFVAMCACSEPCVPHTIIGAHTMPPIWEYSLLYLRLRVTVRPCTGISHSE